MDTIKFGKATLHINFLGDMGEDYLGAGYWETSLKALHDLHEISQFKTDNFEFYNRDPIWDPDEHDEDETYGDSNGDVMILFLGAAHYHGGEFTIDYHGSEYWFWHDAVHAEYDCGDGTDLYIDSDGEERALIEGAILAIKNGVPFSDVLSELSEVNQLDASTGMSFEERFGYKFDPVVALLEDSRVNVTIEA